MKYTQIRHNPGLLDLNCRECTSLEIISPNRVLNRLEKDGCPILRIYPPDRRLLYQHHTDTNGSWVLM